MLKKVIRSVILGAPASGKGTISKRLVDKFGLVHISPGDILRQNVAKSTELGKKAKIYIDQGKLVPDGVINEFVLQHLAKLSEQSWLLDGYPRTVIQAERLRDQVTLDVIIRLNVPHEVIIDRVRGRWIHLASGRVYNIGYNEPKVAGKDDLTGEDLIQRDDDKPHVVAQRLQVYEEMMKPVFEFYEKHCDIHTFNGNTTAEIWPKIEKLMQAELAAGRS